MPEQFERWRGQGVNAFLLGDDRSLSFRALKGNRAQYTEHERAPIHIDDRLAGDARTDASLFCPHDGSRVPLGAKNISDKE